ncbi:peptidoglycan-binding domain-containing protein [Subtercola boreus]|nr:peptidoglycan-binding domain-containing protein [Subtercola boreus]
MIGVAGLVAGGVVAGWALTVVLSPPGAAADPAAFATVTVTEGEVGSRLALNVAAEWQALPVGTNEAVGVVTSVDATAGTVAAAGARLYGVNERPVVAAQGSVPAYRDIGSATSGDDAAQLQGLLRDLGVYAGAIDGTIGTDSVAAIERWQQALGVDATGTVRLGDVVFVPTLPARLTLKTDVVRRGARLGGGEEVVLALGSAPQFTLPAGEAQSAEIPTGARVEITAAGGQRWEASVAGRAAAPSGGTVVLGLEPAPAGGASGAEAAGGAMGAEAAGGAMGAAPAGGAAGGDAAGEPGAAASICGAACDSVPVTGQTLLAAEIVTLETVRGTVVPAIALRSDPQHALSLLDEGGVAHPVTVTAEARGMAVVGGVQPGLRVRVPSAVAP